ncbi:hypothetical protein PQI23_06625 [Leucobacter sp. USCH14]|uniref:hypothetical protein n=1 Tax=Leucobacter sp. USCH14 TaxID=3024838 RepID=UPI0030B05190
MTDYANAWDLLASAIGAAKNESAGSIADVSHLTVDQRIEVAKVAALLSISQELSGLRQGEGAGPERIEAHLSRIAMHVNGDKPPVEFRSFDL